MRFSLIGFCFSLPLSCFSAAYCLMDSVFDKIVGRMQSHGEERAREQQMLEQVTQFLFVSRPSSTKNEAWADIEDDMSVGRAVRDGHQSQASARAPAMLSDQPRDTSLALPRSKLSGRSSKGDVHVRSPSHNAILSDQAPGTSPALPCLNAFGLFMFSFYAYARVLFFTYMFFVCFDLILCL